MCLGTCHYSEDASTLCLAMRRHWAKLFGKQLANVRKAKGVKQHELEDKIGSGPKYISHLETGRSKAGFDNIFEIADALDSSASDLFFLEGLDDRKEVLQRRIQDLLGGCDERRLRKIYRLILVALEK
jgi:transcriptional regulator with XRE-family HTH domain